MKTISRIIVLIIFCLGACTSFKEGLVQSGSPEDAIQNAILDFSNTTKLYKKHDVFKVGIKESAVEEILIVRVGRNNMKLLVTENGKPGSMNSKMPTRFIKEDGKLFFWWDEDFPLTEKALSVFAEYDLLQDDEGGIIKIPQIETDDAQKAAHYYFCKNNLTQYKKVVTNRGIGYYDYPSLKCESSK